MQLLEKDCSKIGLRRFYDSLIKRLLFRANRGIVEEL